MFYSCRRQHEINGIQRVAFYRIDQNMVQIAHISSCIKHSPGKHLILLGPRTDGERGWPNRHTRYTRRQTFASSESGLFNTWSRRDQGLGQIMTLWICSFYCAWDISSMQSISGESVGLAFPKRFSFVLARIHGAGCKLCTASRPHTSRTNTPAALFTETGQFYAHARLCTVFAGLITSQLTLTTAHFHLHC